MVKKGLCITCANDKTCTFPRKFPVWQCEEFSEYVTKAETKPIDVKKKKIKATDEITIEE